MASNAVGVIGVARHFMGRRRGVRPGFALLEHFNQSREVVGNRSVDEVAIMRLQKLTNHGRHRPHGICISFFGSYGLVGWIGWGAAASTFV